MNSTSKISLPLLMLAIVFLSGCQSMTRTGETKAVCSVFPPITYSRNDTPETALQVRQHNAARAVYCK